MVSSLTSNTKVLDTPFMLFVNVIDHILIIPKSKTYFQIILIGVPQYPPEPKAGYGHPAPAYKPAPAPVYKPAA